jgi:hypothetical protein
MKKIYIIQLFTIISFDKARQHNFINYRDCLLGGKNWKIKEN